MSKTSGTTAKRCCLIVLYLLLMIPGCRRDSDEEIDIINISNTRGYSEHPAIAADSRGYFYVVWDEQFITQESLFVYMVTRSPSGEWSEPEKIFEPWAAQFPDIEIDKHNTIHLIWRNTDHELWGEVLYTKKPVEGTWTEPETISIYGKSCSPDMVVDDNGIVHLIWQELIDDWPIFYSQKKANGYWSWPVKISRGSAEYRFDPQIAVGKHGDVHVVWVDNYAHEIALIFKDVVVYTTNAIGDTWSYPEKLYIDKQLETSSPSIALDNVGVIHVVWKSHGDIFYTHKSPGSEWETPVRVCFTDPLSVRPCLVVDAANTLHLAWFEDERKLAYTTKIDDNDWKVIKYYSIDIMGLMTPNLAISTTAIGVVFTGYTEIDSIGQDNTEIFFVEIPLY